MLRKDGFTLIELMLSTSILTVVGILSFVALKSAAVSMATAEARAQSDGSIRDGISAMFTELELAAKNDDIGLGVSAMAVNDQGSPVSAGTPGDEVIFQVPNDTTGDVWSTTVRYLFVNEDVNANGLLDSSEDTDLDGVLTRRIQRIQDINDDGDTTDPGEVQTIGGTNDLAQATFSLNTDGDMLTINLLSTRAVSNTLRIENGSQYAHLTRASVTSQIYIMN